MATPAEKLAQSLEALTQLQTTADGATAIRARDLSRTHRERLLGQGFLQPVLKGWLIPSRPDEVKRRVRREWRRVSIGGLRLWAVSAPGERPRTKAGGEQL